MKPAGVRRCDVAPLLGRHGRAASQAEILSGLLSSEGCFAIATSPRLNPVVRAADMAVSVLRWRKRVDVVVLHVYSGRAFVSADLLSLEVHTLRRPLVLALHGGGLPAFQERHPSWVRRVIGRSDLLVAPSQFMARHFGDYGKPLTVIPNTVRLDDYEFRPRRLLRPRLLWMRAFSEIYRPVMAVESLARLRQLVPDATLTMAGAPGPLLEPARDLAVKLGVSAAVTFRGYLDGAEKRRAFADHDLFVVTNEVENTPVSVIEAAASGLPVVACRAGGIGDLIEDGRSGVIVDDPSDLEAAIVRLLENPDLAAELSAHGREMAEGFDWPIVRAQWEALYESLPSAVGA